MITSEAMVSIPENTGTDTTVVDVDATDQDAGDTVTYDISGADAEHFNIDPVSGLLTFAASPDYENPADDGADNTYDLTVTATDGSLAAMQALAITVTDVNEAPVITSEAMASVAENTSTDTTVIDVDATDMDAGDVVAYSISGADAGQFNIDSASGALTFAVSPNYESPADSDADNTYNLTVTATSGSHSAMQDLVVMVTDVNEAPMIAGALPDQMLEVGGEPGQIDLGAVFADPDGNTLAYTLRVNDPAIASLSVSGNGLTVAALSRGATGFTITASDPDGLSVAQSAMVTVTDEGLREMAAKTLTGFGRSLIASVSGAVGGRLGAPEPGHQAMSADNAVGFLGSFGAATAAPALYQPSAAGGCGALHGGVGNTARRQSGVWPVACAPGGDAWMPEVGAANPYQPNGVAPLNGLDSALSLLPRQFAANLNGQTGRGAFVAWGSLDQQSWDGDGYDGKTTSVYVGMDHQFTEHWLLGVAVARNDGESDYSFGTATQSMNAELTTFLPYVRFGTPSGDTRLWGILGFGNGDFDSTVVGAEDTSSDLDMNLYLFGGRQRISQAAGLDLAIIGDLALTKLETEDGDGAVDGLEADASRVRVGIEVSFDAELGNGGALTPFAEINLRHDGGDDDNGTGLEITGGVRLAQGVFSLEASGRTLAVHSAEDYSESGFSLVAAVNPAANGTGLSARVGSRWGGGATSSGMFDGQIPALGRGLSQQDLAHRATGSERLAWNGQIGYGLMLRHARYLVTPFVDVNLAASGRREYLLGAQLDRRVADGAAFNLKLGVGAVTDQFTGSGAKVSLLAALRF